MLPENGTVMRSDQTEFPLGNEASMFSDNGCSISLNFDDRTLENFDTGIFGMISNYDLSDYSSTNWLDFINLATETRPPQEPPALHTNSHEYSFPFLDGFTSRTGLVSSFDCGSPIQRQEVLAAVLRSLAKGGLEVSQSVPKQVVTRTGRSKDAMPFFAIPLTQYSSLFDPLSLKSHEITLLVKEVVTVKPRNSTVTITWSPSLEIECSVFFSPANLRKFLEFYWAIWHPNVNFVHRPMFDPAGCKSILLATMVLIGKCDSLSAGSSLTTAGACVSPDSSDNEDAKTWFNCVEEMVFIDDDFCSDTLSSDTASFNPLSNRPKIEALQAAYMVVLYQNWEGTDASKRRMRRYRYSNVVSVSSLEPSVGRLIKVVKQAARDIGIDSAKHVNYHEQSKEEFNWGGFVAREELIR